MTEATRPTPSQQRLDFNSRDATAPSAESGRPAPSTHANRLEASPLRQIADLPAEWRVVLAQPAAAAALTTVSAHIEARLAAGAVIYPATPFRALQTLTPALTRVVIIGQDPYHGPGQAQGLAFSVPDACRRPPSLRNIFKEIAREWPDKGEPAGNDLSAWARQGVLLLNTSLTVEDGQAGSHAKKGWEAVTDAIIASVARDESPKVFMLWGAHAQAKAELLPEQGGHLMLRSNHPSPLSASRPPVPFVGCGHFSRANAWLRDRHQPEINWYT